MSVAGSKDCNHSGTVTNYASSPRTELATGCLWRATDSVEAQPEDWEDRHYSGMSEVRPCEIFNTPLFGGSHKVLVNLRHHLEIDNFSSKFQSKRRLDVEPNRDKLNDLG